MSTLSERLHALVRRREPSLPVGLVRIAVGLGALIKLLDVAPKLWAATRPQVFLLPYWEALPRPTPGWILTLTTLWAISALLFAAGWFGRKPGVVLTLVLAAVLVVDRQIYSNHLYLLALLVGLLTLADSTRAASLDARHGFGAPEVAGWPVTLLRWQLTILYFFAAVSKLNGAFLSGAVLIEQLPHFSAYPAILRLVSWIGLAAEWWLALGLWLPRTRVVSAWIGVAFHGTVLIFMQPKPELVVFGLESLALYLLFFPPATVERWLGRRSEREV